MTRKDYELIARVLRDVRSYTLGSTETVDRIVATIADKLQADNPRFSIERFKSAIGIALPTHKTIVHNAYGDASDDPKIVARMMTK